MSLLKQQRVSIVNLSVQRLVLIPVALCGISAANATNVTLCTDLGRVVIELFDDDAPQHVANFLDYTDRGFYGGTVFHRVIPGFVVQGGGFDKDLRGKRPSRTVPNESRNGHDNLRGTVAAARTSNPDSASSQFFVNLTDNTDLDATRREPGYTVFGRVIEGMSVIDEIAALPTGPSGAFASDVPEPLVAVNSVTRLTEEQFADTPYAERHGPIRAQIDAALSVNDPAAVFGWIQQMRNACGSMDPDLLIVEADAAVAVSNQTAALAALEEYLRVADDTHADYGQTLETYLALAPEPEENDATQAMMPSIAEIAGHCTPAQFPIIPDARTATMDEMVTGQTDVRTFMSVSNEQLACLSELIDRGELTKEERAMLASYYNRRVDAMESVAAEFNEQVKLIRARQ
ncbi:MAG: peptidylprolyl isomerase [Rhodospirillaceae bacterium]|nr:peptidylprolyl isomerase [Rhodospirillaceae bacterium]